jgi:Cu(I)/Ag(I) efflux system membrane protein CusA/SilA
MVPMAIPSFGGMVVVVFRVLTVPVLYSWFAERRAKSTTPVTSG